MTKLNTTNQMVREFERVLGAPVQRPKFKRHEQARVPVYGKDGKVITTVLKQCTSIGAAKAAKATACEWSMRHSPAGWVVK